MNTLLSELTALFDIPPQALQVYKDLKERFTTEVNQQFMRNPQNRALIQAAPPRMIFDNIVNHHSIMFESLRTQSPQTLLTQLSWEYPTYIIHGVDKTFFAKRAELFINILSEESEDLSALVALYRWMISENDALIQAFSDHAKQEEAFSDDALQLYDSLISGDLIKSEQLCQLKEHSFEKLQQVYTDLIQKAMTKVGQEWEKGNISVANEHMASALSTKLATELYLSCPKEPQRQGKIVVTTPKKENHALGALMVANALEVKGYDVTLLSQKASVENILETLKTHQPDILVISISMPENMLNAQELIDAVKELKLEKPIKVMIGGYLILTHPELAASLPADAVTSSLDEAQEIIDAWLQGA